MQRFMQTALSGILYFAIISYYIKIENATEKLQNYYQNPQSLPMGATQRAACRKYAFAVYIFRIL